MIDDPHTPGFLSKQKTEIDDILSDIDDDLSDDVLDIESFDDAPLKANKFSGFKPKKSSNEFIGGKSRSSAPLLLGALAVLVAGGAGAYFYFTGDMSGTHKIAVPLAPLAPTATPAAPQDMPENMPENMGADITAGLPQTPPALDQSIDAATPELPSALPDVGEPAVDAVTPAVPAATLPAEIAPIPASPPIAQPPIAQPPIAQPAPAKSETVAGTDAIKTDAIKTDVVSPSPNAPAQAQVPAPPIQEAMKGEDKTNKVTKPAQNVGKIKYFDAPNGEMLDDIKPPSIDVTREPGESIIIVQKPAGFSSESYRAGGDDSVRIERSGATDVTAQNSVAADRALRLGRYDMAREFYNDILAQNSNDVSALLGRAIADQKMGNVDAAMNGYRDVLRRDQSNITAATNLAGLQSAHSPESALNNLEKVYNANPDDPAVKGQMGVSLAESGNADAAYMSFLKATQAEPKNPQHFYNLAVISDRLGKRVEAVAAYEKCLEVDAIYGTGRGINREVIYDRLAKLRAQ